MPDVYCLVQIEPDAKCMQERGVFIWSHLERLGILKNIKPETIFIGRKLRDGEWDCKAKGVGMPSPHYGNGSICADNVKILSPMSYREPELPT